jgi:ankyrin repeat protein
MLAALFGRVEIARALLLAGADPARRDELGNDARSLVEGQGNAELVRLLDEPARE